MYGSPQKQGSSSSQYKKTVPLKGLFKDGIWHCNCNPRLPATRFQVKKEGPNKGKWFYTCQEPKEDGCGFFLWDERAISREMGVVINNTRSEPDHLRTPADASRDKRTIEGHNAASNKWIRDLGRSKRDDFGEWPSSEEEDRKETKAATPSIPGAYPETPRKAIKTGELLTPGSKRQRDNEYLPTPVTNPKEDDVFITSSVTRLKGGMWDGNEPFSMGSPSITPTPSRFRDASVSGESQSSGTNEYDITKEVMELLKDQHIGHETTSSLQTLLNKHALKISGIAKGRDITRMALKLKDAKIAELHQRINALETEREMDKSLIKQYIVQKSMVRDGS